MPNRTSYQMLLSDNSQFSSKDEITCVFRGSKIAKHASCPPVSLFALKIPIVVFVYYVGMRESACAFKQIIFFKQKMQILRASSQSGKFY